MPLSRWQAHSIFASICSGVERGPADAKLHAGRPRQGRQLRRLLCRRCARRQQHCGALLLVQLWTTYHDASTSWGAFTRLIYPLRPAIHRMTHGPNPICTVW